MNEHPSVSALVDVPEVPVVVVPAVVPLVVDVLEFEAVVVAEVADVASQEPPRSRQPERATMAAKPTWSVL